MIVDRVIGGVNVQVDSRKPNAIMIQGLREDKARSLRDITDVANFFFEEASKIQKHYLPLVLTLELTDTCSFNCPFCFIHTHQSTKHKIPYISLKSVSAQLIDEGLLYCTITGGEALTYPFFEEYYRFLREHGVMVTLFTNGAQLNEKIKEILLRYPPFRVEVSLYGIDEDKFFQATGQNRISSKQVLENILWMKENGIQIVCKTPVNNLTIGSFREIKNWCESHRIDFYYSTKVFNAYNGEPRDSFSIESDVAHEITVKRFRELNLSNKDFRHKKKVCFDCGAGKYGFFISHDFRLRPCMAFHQINEAQWSLHEGSAASFEKLVNFIERHKGKNLYNCKGCEASFICKECVISSLRPKDNQDVFQKKCFENRAVAERIMYSLGGVDVER